MSQTVEVRFKGTRRAFYQWPHEDTEPLRLQESVIVGADRGEDLGRVSAVGDVAAKKCGGSCACPSDGTADTSAAPAGPAEFPAVLRRATQAEIRKANDIRREEEEDRRRIVAKAREHKLEMKVSDVEWQWDRHQLTVYFSAEQRVDFRALVRELAGAFRTRIDMRQIGVRDEAARIGGVGRCGREYCCSTWLTELSPVNLSLAKDQHLSLNPSQISGGCGRLLCCLKYEHEFYVQSRKRFPREGKLLQTQRGTEKVIAVDIFRERVYLRGADESRTVGLVELREEMEGAGASVADGVAVAEPPGQGSPARQERQERQASQERQGRPARTERPARNGRTAANERTRGTAADSAAKAAPAAPAAPAGPTGATAPGAPTDPSRSKKRRRRRRRGGGGGGSSTGTPGNPSTPEA